MKSWSIGRKGVFWSLAALLVLCLVMAGVGTVGSAECNCFKITWPKCDTDMGLTFTACKDMCDLGPPWSPLGCGEGWVAYEIPREQASETGFYGYNTDGPPTLCALEYSCIATDRRCPGPGLPTYWCASVQKIDFLVSAGIYGVGEGCGQ